jgi:hypothetical protein
MPQPSRVVVLGTEGVLELDAKSASIIREKESGFKFRALSQKLSQLVALLRAVFGTTSHYFSRSSEGCATGIWSRPVSDLTNRVLNARFAKR